MGEKLITFRIAVEYNADTLALAKEVLVDYNVEVYDVRAAEVLLTKTDKIVGMSYLLCCRGSAYTYLQLKENMWTTEVKVDGFRTLFNKSEIPRRVQ